MSRNYLLTLDAGSDFIKSLIAIVDNQVLNLTDYTLFAQLRKHAESTAYYEFSGSIDKADTGAFSIAMAGADSISIAPGKYFFDVLAKSTTNTHRVAEGIVVVTAAVTRIPIPEGT